MYEVIELSSVCDFFHEGILVSERVRARASWSSASSAQSALLWSNAMKRLAETPSRQNGENRLSKVLPYHQHLKRM